MDVDILPLHKIFALDVQFRVPLFQRPYVWERDRQWEPLWEDVILLAERYLEEGVDTEQHHFLGAVVVRQRLRPLARLETRDVIDGQQRLTTLQLLADAVEETIRELDGPKSESHRLRKLTLNDSELFAGDDQFKIWPTNADQDVFRHAMVDEMSMPDELAEAAIAKAHSYFRSKARDWMVDTDLDSAIDERCEALVNAIDRGVHLVVIDLKEDDNAQAIFETLNARGTPLLASDLVKNHMLHEAQAQGLDVEQLHGDHWHHLDTPWWREEITLGRVRWPRLDAFLFYWLSMSVAREVSTQKLFDEYRSYVKDSDISVQAVAEQLSQFSSVFSRLMDEPDSAHVAFFYRWEVSQLRVMTPLLLWLFSEDAAIDAEDLADALGLLESWFMRRMVCGRTTRGYQNFLHPIVREIKQLPGSDVPSAIGSILSDAAAQNTEWPLDSEIHESIQNRPLYLQLSRARLRMVLEAVEDWLRQNDAKAESSCPKNLTIEHLLPQQWSENNYPLEGTQLDRHERWNRLHTLGNLTLVNDKLNPAMSNSEWRKKRDELAKHSTLHLNKALAISGASPGEYDWYADWNDNTILERSEWLAERICEIWPRPE